MQAAKLKQDNYADFLFSKEFQPLGAIGYVAATLHMQ